MLFTIGADWSDVFRHLLHPSVVWDRTTWSACIALAGTTISPYLFVWQAAEEFEEIAHDSGIADISRHHVRAMRLDVVAGMLSGVVIMFAIMVTTGDELFAAGITHIESAEQVATALRPLAGDFAGLVFALGILGVGLLAIPVLAGASAYAVAEVMNWPESLERRPGRAKAFYAVIAVSMILALLLNGFGINPMVALYLAAVTNGIAAPVLLFLISILASRDSVMGELRSGAMSRVLVFATATLMAAAPLAWLAAAH